LFAVPDALRVLKELKALSELRSNLPHESVTDLREQTAVVLVVLSRIAEEPEPTCLFRVHKAHNNCERVQLHAPCSERQPSSRTNARPANGTGAGTWAETRTLTECLGGAQG